MFDGIILTQKKYQCNIFHGNGGILSKNLNTPLQLNEKSCKIARACLKIHSRHPHALIQRFYKKATKKQTGNEVVYGNNI